MKSTPKQVEVRARTADELPDDAGDLDGRTLNRKVKVVEIGTGVEHELAGDTPTRDARTLAYFSHPSGAVLPLVIRPPDAVFYVCGEQYSALFGKLVRRPA